MSSLVHEDQLCATYCILWYRRWHRVGISVKGTSVTLVLDCKVLDVLPLNRTYPGSQIDTSGFIYVGSRPGGSLEGVEVGNTHTDEKPLFLI